MFFAVEVCIGFCVFSKQDVSYPCIISQGKSGISNAAHNAWLQLLKFLRGKCAYIILQQRFR